MATLLHGTERAVTSGGPVGRLPGEVVTGTPALAFYDGAYVYRRTDRFVALADEDALQARAADLTRRAGGPRNLSQGDALRLAAQGCPTRNHRVYEYDPAVSPGHAAAVLADAEAVAEVAAREGVSMEVVLGRARAAKQAAKGQDHPARLLLEEAARRGVDPAVLIEEHAARQAEEADRA